jgi:hypothetical protein
MIPPVAISDKSPYSLTVGVMIQGRFPDHDIFELSFGERSRISKMFQGDYPKRGMIEPFEIQGFEGWCVVNLAVVEVNRS